MVCPRNLLQLPKSRVTTTTTNNPASPHHKTYTYSSVLKVIYTTKYTTTRLLHSQNNQKIPLIILPPAQVQVGQPFHHNHSTTTLQPLRPPQPNFLKLPGETLQLLFFSWINQDSWSWSTGMKISGLSWGGNSRHPTEDMYLPLGEYNKIVILCLKTYSEKTNHHMEVLLRKLHL